MRSRTSLSAAALAVVWAGCGADGTGPFREDQLDWNGRVDAGDAIEIKGVMGPITAYPTTGSLVEVRAVKSGGSSGDRDAVWFEVIRHGGGVTVCAMYPSVAGARANVCGVGDEGVMNVQDIDVQVAFTVYLPDGVDFVGRNVSGRVRADDLDGDVTVVTVSGDVDAATTGAVEAVTVSGNVDVAADGMIVATTVSGNVDLYAGGLATATTVSGDIEAALGVRTIDRDLVFSAVSGNVTVWVRPDVNMYAYMMTTSGRLACDFALTHTSNVTWEGRLGAGGGEMMLWSVSGNVALLELP